MNRVKQDKGTTSFRVKSSSATELEKLASELGHGSANSIGNDFLEAMITLVNTPPERRTLPKIISLIDAARKNQPLISLPQGSETEEKVAKALRREAGR